MTVPAFLNRCIWVATSSGTGDFVVSAATQNGYTPAQCADPAVVNSATYHYFATNGAEHEEGDGAYNTGTNTLARTTIRNSSNAGSKVSFSAPPVVTMGGPIATDMLAIGTAIGGGASSGSVLFIDTSGNLGQDNANFNWDDTNHSLIIGSGSSTVTSSSPMIDGAQTWNNGAVVFTGTKINITNTASAAGSLIADWQLAGTSLVNVGINGVLGFGGHTSSFPGLINSGTELQVNLADNSAYTTLSFAGAFAYNLGSTGATNYERGKFAFVGNVLTIGTENGGTGTTRNMQFIIGGGVRADYGISSAGNWTFNGGFGFTTYCYASNPSSPGLYFNNTGPTYYGIVSCSQVASVATAMTFGRATSIGGTITHQFFAICETGIFGLGGMTSSFPGIVNSGAILVSRLADNSADAAFRALTVQTGVVAVASLPAAGTKGRRYFVSDANATTFASIVAGGGANNVPVYDDGTNWRIG